MRKCIQILAVVAALGCASLSDSWRATAGPDPSPRDLCLAECVHYDDAYMVWYALGMTFSGVSAASGTGGVLAVALTDEPYSGISLAAAAAASGTATLVFNWLAGENAERYTVCVDRCRLPEPFTAEAAMP